MNKIVGRDVLIICPNFREEFIIHTDPKTLLRLRCPVAGCLGGVSNSSNLRFNFAHHPMWGEIVILEDGNQPYPRCPKCDMFVSHRSLNGHHLVTNFCLQG